MDHTATIALIGFALIVGTYLLPRLIGAMRVNRPKLPHGAGWPMEIVGDVPAIPREMRQGARISPGGGASNAPCAQTRTNAAIARHGGAV
jgi:hypothetical protein